ncbi:class I SAM-dependent methyltransferase [Rhizobium sp. BK251]|uniref:class I SAM-dependent methyltransferase n=1 Tax=Rhizobium sp. BK251 TaxID=2512125 RepID=UPI0010458E2B|nr:class I SAM-dependent methyltransferase [Rhizobium sp. BK251]TCL70405.1 methyltransferase family protein [Rhizobium sp. BK251]
MNRRICWCGNHDLLSFNAEYGKCSNCGTLVSVDGLTEQELQPSGDEEGFYGKRYWLDHQKKDLGFPDIFARSRSDLVDRNLYWLKILLKYRLPSAKVLELGCSHGSFVRMMRQAGYDASGLELSPWVVEFARNTFDVPVSMGPIEDLELEPATLDVVVLMDVLEHLPDPERTMGHALRLLKPDGLLLVQTPQFNGEGVYEDLVKSESAFQGMLRPDEHIYLFTEESARRLFAGLGANHVTFEPAVFYQHDMFFVVSRQPIVPVESEKATEALASTPTGRFVQAMLDLDERVKALSEHVKVIDADRAERLEQIHKLTAMVHEAQGIRGRIIGR